MAHITITYDKVNGTFKVEGHGFIGSECVSKLSDVVNMLNGTTLSRRIKSEILRTAAVEPRRLFRTP